MEATMVNKIKNSKVISAVALMVLLSACGQGFKVRQHQELSSNISNVQNFRAFNSQSDDGNYRAPASTAPTKTTPPIAANDNEPVKFRFVTLYPNVEAKVLDRYKHVDPKHEINTKLLKDALLFYYVNNGSFMNKKFITVIDYSRPSSQKRLYVIEVSSGRVWSTYVAHGRGSDRNHDGMPEVFNNKINSFATSVGPYLTLGSYQGEHGLSLRLKGLSNLNSNAFDRNIVIHGAAYVRDDAAKQGRSLGCPAVAQKYSAKLINSIKGGSLVFSGASKPSMHRQL